jgi:hypothetical protein
LIERCIIVIGERIFAMIIALQIPTPETVKAACERFDRENELIEQTLSELFQQYPRNDDLRHVLLKVVAVNSLYHTCIYALDTVARHIHSHAPEIDAALAAGSHEIVDKIAKVRVQGKVHNFFSFATKYCNWHQPEKYPIYDTRVDHYLWTLQQQNAFAKTFQHPHLWDYPKFHSIVVTFRDAHGLSAFTFKQIDKFLYLQGERPNIPIPDEPQPGVGAFDFFPALEI